MREPSKPVGGDQYIPTLDGWRAISILLVLAFHSPGWDQQFFMARHGTLGVAIFFVISGYLITSRLLSEKNQNRSISLKSFYIRRLFRLAPAAGAYLVITLILGLFQVIPLGWKGLLACILLVRNYWWPTDPGDNYSGHFWSLTVEEHFYLLFPFLITFARRRQTFAIIIFAITLAVIWRYTSTRLGWYKHYSNNPFFFLLTDLRIDNLLWGCLAAVCIDLWKWRPTGTIYNAISWVLIFILFYCLHLIFKSTNIYFSLMPPTVTLALVITAHNPQHILGRFLELPPMRWLGRISYSLYLFQQLFMIHLMPPETSWLGQLQVFPYNFLASFACATISYYCLERPMISLGKRFLRRSKTIPAPTTSPSA